MEVKNNGIEFDVYDGSEHLGDFYVSKKGVTWATGKTSRANGIVVPWKKLIKLIEESQ